MRLHTALIAATVLSAACVSDHYAPLRADWAGTEVSYLENGEVLETISLPFSMEIPDSGGIFQNISIDATVDEANMITFTTAWSFTQDGDVLESLSCDQTSELVMNEETGAFETLTPEVDLGDGTTCSEMVTTCTLSDDADEMTCDMMPSFDGELLEGQPNQRVTFMVAEAGDTAE